MEEVKKAIIELLKIRKNHCMPITELGKALEKKMPDKYPGIVKLYDIVKELELEGKVEFYKAGELYLEGMIPTNSVALPGGDCIPEKYKIKIEKEGKGISKELEKKINKIDLHLLELRDEFIDIKKDIRRMRVDVEMVKDLVWEMPEKIVKIITKGKKK